MAAPTRIRRPSRETVRQRLIETAIAVFERDGYSAASLSAISEEAGFSRGAVYSNFAGKEDLFLAALERHAFNQMDQIFAAGTDPRLFILKPKKSAAAQTRNWALLFVAFCISIKDDTVLLARLRETRLRMRQRLAGLLIENRRCSNERHARAVAAAIMAINNGLIIEGLCDPGLETKLQKVLPTMVDALLAGGGR